MRSDTINERGAPRRFEEGFSLVELMVVIAIAAVCVAITIGVNPQFIGTARADSGLAQALDVLRSAREAAISQRRNVRVVFSGTNVIQTEREDINAAGAVTGVTVLRTVALEGRLRFMLVPGVPDTPDFFGRTAAIAFPASANWKFSTEGTFINAMGDPINGTVFMAVPEEPNSARAITFLGATGFLRVWRWNGREWTE